MPELPRMFIKSRLDPTTLKHVTDPDISVEIHRLLSDMVDLIAMKVNVGTTEYKAKSQQIVNEQLMAMARLHGLKLTITVEAEDPQEVTTKRFVNEYTKLKHV